MVNIQNISVSYKVKEPLHNFSLFLQPGEKVVLTGPSGSGKSSLLNAIAGFVIPKQGTIIVDGEVMSPVTIPSIRQKMAYLPQEINIDLESGLDLLMYTTSFNANRHLAPTQRQVESLLSDLDLTSDLLQNKLSEMSLGQRQRLALASVLLLRRPLLLLDEPSSSLDGGCTHKVIDLVLGLENTTVISVSHDDRWIASFNRKIEINT